MAHPSHVVLYFISIGNKSTLSGCGKRSILVDIAVNNLSIIIHIEL
jgi:hypothetical protein